MGKVACAYDNSPLESIFGSEQIELLGRCDWTTRTELVDGSFERIEAFYNRTRHPSWIGHLRPIDFVMRRTAANKAA